VRALNLDAGAQYTLSLVAGDDVKALGVVRANDRGVVDTEFFQAAGTAGTPSSPLELSHATQVVLRNAVGDVVLVAETGPSANTLRTFVETGLRYLGTVEPGAPMPHAVARCGFDGLRSQTLDVEAEAPHGGAEYELYLDGQRVAQLSGDPGASRRASRRVAFSNRPPNPNGTPTLPLPQGITKVTNVGRVVVVERRHSGAEWMAYTGGLATWAFQTRGE
jgi:hypothetical protein